MMVGNVGDDHNRSTRMWCSSLAEANAHIVLSSSNGCTGKKLLFVVLVYLPRCVGGVLVD